MRPARISSKGGKPFELFEGKAQTTVTFSAPGEYWLHVTANDYSGFGGGGSTKGPRVRPGPLPADKSHSRRNLF